MSKCIDPKYEQMIHSFEVGLLTEEDRLGFEQHLLECEHCFEEVRAFLPASILIRHDERIKQDCLPKRGLLSSWPKGFRIVALAAMLVVFFIPAYYLALRDSGPDISIQELDLLPARSGASPVLHLDQGDSVRIRFSLDSAGPSTVFSLIIASRSGEVVFKDDHFKGFDSAGVGLIKIPVTDFKAGFHTLTVSDMTGSLSVPQRVYNFRAK